MTRCSICGEDPNAAPGLHACGGSVGLSNLPVTAPSVVPGRPLSDERLEYVATWIDAIAAGNANLLETHRFQTTLAGWVREAAVDLARLRLLAASLDDAKGQPLDSLAASVPSRDAGGAD